jgi:hypothetical protein
MTNREHRYAWAAARVLRAAWPSDSESQRHGHRDQIVAAMELEMAKGRRRRRAVVGGALAMAAAAALVVGLRLASPGTGPVLAVEQVIGQGNLLVRAASTQALSTSVTPVEGDELRSDETGGLTLGFRNGTRLALSRAGRLRVDAVGRLRRFLLLRGQVEAEVARLVPPERFIVDTPDAEVEVRGTRFSVAHSDASADCASTKPRSAVVVREGTVWVRSGGREVVLGAGESWTAPCAGLATEPGGQAPAVDRRASADTAAPTATPERPAVRRPSVGSPSERRASVPSVAAPMRVPPAGSPEPDRPTSNLAEQNDLLSAAMAAERAGEHELALRKLDQLLTRFPDGPLSETAHIERQRIRAVEARPGPR